VQTPFWTVWPVGQTQIPLVFLTNPYLHAIIAATQAPSPIEHPEGEGQVLPEPIELETNSTFLRWPLRKL